MGSPGDASESLDSLLSKNGVSDEVRSKVKEAGFTCLLSFPHALRENELGSWFLTGTAFCSSIEKLGHFDLQQELLRFRCGHPSSQGRTSRLPFPGG